LVASTLFSVELHIINYLPPSAQVPNFYFHFNHACCGEISYVPNDLTNTIIHGKEIEIKEFVKCQEPIDNKSMCRDIIFSN
jgi:hypothetical protein